MTRGRASVPTVFFITHPDVAIDPAVAIPDWPLDGCGRERMRATAGLPWARNVRRVFASSERKARDGAEILAAGLNISRGLLRLWVVLSVLWILGASLAYRPQPAACQYLALAPCILHLYEAATLDKIPVDLPEGQTGVQWDALTPVQQMFVSSWFFAEQSAIGDAIEKLKSNNYEPKVQFYKNLARGFQIDRPEALQYSVVSAANLSRREADWFRHGWLDEYRSRLKKAAAEFVAICLGLPGAIALTGFLAFRAGRWILGGFKAH
jgi:hypothetical protein